MELTMTKFSLPFAHNENFVMDVSFRIVLIVLAYKHQIYAGCALADVNNIQK